MKKTVEFPASIPRVTLDVFTRKGEPCIVINAGKLVVSITGADAAGLRKLEGDLKHQARSFDALGKMLAQARRAAERKSAQPVDVTKLFDEALR